jgi:hypothetical protein
VVESRGPRQSGIARAVDDALPFLRAVRRRIALEAVDDRVHLTKSCVRKDVICRGIPWVRHAT